MKFTLAASATATLLFATALAAPAAEAGDRGSYGSYGNGGAGHGNYQNGAPNNNNNKNANGPFIFTSTYNIVALGSEVRNGTTAAPGPDNAVGYFNYGINSFSNTICYNITLLNVAGTYQSPAKTATHIHQAARGASGPPRIALPNPVGDDKKRVSVGCITGPFTTGLNGADGKDTGTGFTVQQIEANPAGFFTDAHTNLYPLGVIRDAEPTHPQQSIKSSPNSNSCPYLPLAENKMLYTHATLITVNPTRDILLDGALLIRNSTIASIGKSTDLIEQYAGTEEVVDLEGRIIIPGLICTHMHTAQTLLRVGVVVMREDLGVAGEFYCRGWFADRYGFDGLCQAVQESGIRGCLGKIVMDIATYAKDSKWAMHPGLVEDRETSLLGAIDMWEKWDRKANDRIRVWFGARTPGGVSDALYKEMTSISREKNIPLTMHCAEVRADREFFDSQNHTPMSYCDSVGLLGPKTVLVHMVHLDDSDIQKLAETGTHVAHCPTSNAKLASGICRLPELLDSGVNVGLGTDGAPCNNTNDLLQEMKLAAIIHKAKSYDPTIVSAEQVLEMATINGAKALGLEDSIGSLEVGKKADFVAVDMRKVHLQPYFSPVSAVVYSVTGRDVELVVVDGKEVVKGGKLQTMDEEEVWKEAQKRSHEIVKRAGLTEKVKGRWHAR
ncbi:guanine deaminase protein [Rutstroemia sp. NJR-2017a BBW]|nr:guanine deaminase protein [Rutstroemia sp. NJR-2017a BBW]